MFNKSLLNVVLLGLGFMLIFTAFQTMGNMQKTVVASIEKEDPTYDGKAYYSLAIIYVSFSIFNWSAPSVISLIGPKFAMVIGATTYLLYMLSFLFPKGWLLYLVSAILGIGAALIWTGQGNYLTLNSTKAKIARYSGIFWCLLQLSLFIGNTFVFFAFEGHEDITKSTRFFVIITLSSVLVGGLVILILLPKAFKELEENEPEEIVEGPLRAFTSAVKLFFTGNMLMLSPMFLYTGLELGFWSGVYSSCIGFTESLDNRKQLVGMSGIFIGLGEVLGGGVFGILGNKIKKFGRDAIVTTGLLIHNISFLLVGLNLPDNSPFDETSDKAFITSNPYLAIFCSFLLGLGDSFYNTQIFALLGSVYSDRSAAAFAIFKFTQCVGAAVSFIYAESLGLYIQLTILAGVSSLSYVSYEFAERSFRKKEEA